MKTITDIKYFNNDGTQNIMYYKTLSILCLVFLLYTN